MTVNSQLGINFSGQPTLVWSKDQRPFYTSDPSSSLHDSEWAVLCCAESLSWPTLCNPMDCSPPGSSVRGDSPGKNTRADCHALLQRIFPTQGSNPGLPHCRQILSHQGSPRILEWVAYPFSRGSSQSRNLIGISCTAGGLSTSWATRKTQNELHSHN